MREQLRSYGLSSKEIDIFLASLKTGEATANRLSELSGIRRSTVYEVVESLKKKSLINAFKKEKKYFFRAVNPETLIELLKEKEREVKSILPELKDLQKTTAEKPSVEVFEGRMGIKNAATEMLNYKEILAYGASTIGDQVLGSYTANFAKKRAEKNILMKAVIEKDIPKHMLEKDVAKVTQLKTLGFLIKHNSVYFIYGNKLLIVTLKKELMAIRVTSPELLESQKKIFTFLWETAN